MTSLTIPNSVTSIGWMAFYDCDILEVISKIESPFTIDTNTFSNNTFNNATLYVPAGSIEKYKAAEGWKRFVSIEEGDPTPDGITWSATPATVVLTQGQVTVNGANDGTSISIYNANGVLLGAAISWNGSATIDTSLHAGNVAIVKVGEKSVKVIAK
ncbi:MAG: leucine-rich repeat protein [Bacteroidaceae bacterium]|nr:leucine-rich repeat protein [Bacteroidaceae bacterium]